jgi:TRAP-type C4-dicarboxylate transport system permease small subunit
MTSTVQNIIGLVAVAVSIVVIYFVDARYVYRKPTSFPGHFFRTNFFPRRALAYAMVVTACLAVLASIRNSFPRDAAVYAAVNNVVLTLVYPLLFIIASIILMLLKTAITRSHQDQA